jgi:NAD(P)-dependent dehydrogenase (short-subunit alcohol dehydrogenase family)
VVNHEQPVFGRMWMTPFADRIRQEASIATIAVGAITDADQANGIIASGRADLVAIGRPHLVNPAWTLSEAARWGYAGATWPDQYLPGKAQLERLLARERAAAGVAAVAADPAWLTWGLAGRHALTGIIAASARPSRALSTKAQRDHDGARCFARKNGSLAHRASCSRGRRPDERVAVQAACAEAAERLGPVDILVNNAGSTESAPFLKSGPELFQRMFSIHVLGAVHATQAVLPGMIERRRGHVINVASTAGLHGQPYVTAYVAAKHALVGLTRALALEMVTRGIAVNAVCPGYTETDLVHDAVARIAQKTGKGEAEALRSILAGAGQTRLVTPEEVAAAVIALCTAPAEAPTGQTVVLDGSRA